MYTRFPLVLLAALSVAVPAISQAALHTDFVEVPISPAARTDPFATSDLTHARTWRLNVGLDHDFLNAELYVKVAGGTIYRNATMSPGTPALSVHPPALYVPWPSLEFETQATSPEGGSFFSVHAPGVRYPNDYDGPVHLYNDASLHIYTLDYNAMASTASFPLLQITVVPDVPDGSTIGFEWILRVYEEDANGAVIENIATSPGITSPFAADANYDYRIDEDDLDVWRANVGAVATLPTSFAHLDVQGDGDTDEADVAVLLSNMFATNATLAQGDVTGDGTVNDDDRKSLSPHGWGHKWNPADVDQDLDVDGNDFLLIQRQLGAGFTIPEPAAVSAGVVMPEPTTAAAAFVAILALASAARRQALAGY